MLRLKGCREDEGTEGKGREEQVRDGRNSERDGRGYCGLILVLLKGSM